MLIASKYEVPDDCPSDCCFRMDMKSFDQGSICCRCPIFNCKKTPDASEYGDKDGMFCLIEPENYREDWAKVWYEWFRGDMKYYPVLYFVYPDGD